MYTHTNIQDQTQCTTGGSVRPYLGPTVYEAAVAEIRRIEGEIQDLQDRLRVAKHRRDEYAGSQLLEAERVATHAEKFMRVPLPENPQELLEDAAE
jgi:hypothetical protein